MPECDARLVYRPEYAGYDFGPQHPLRPERLAASLDLFSCLGIAAADSEQLGPSAASLEELELVHTRSYVDAVQRLDLYADEPHVLDEAARWGLGAGDSPAFNGMHSASAFIAGGTLHALRGVLDGAFAHAFNPGGGLHHAARERASGFCIYNDAAIAMAAALVEHEARVLYLDFDAHHGDGVQAAFYDEPRVLTFSIHETGRHLFPGTGFSHELGEGIGRGYSLNLPVEPFTEDDSWLEVLHLLLPPLAEWFAPDVIVSQHGCDSHAWDPLTDLRLSTRVFLEQARLVHDLAHEVTGGRWVALGGGGYDWARVVPRSWASVWATMRGRALPARLPESWTARWSAAAAQSGLLPFPERVIDDTAVWPASPRRAEISQTNRDRANELRRLALPALVRHVYPAYRIDAAPPKLPDFIMEAGAATLESRTACVETSRGPLHLRDLCPPSFIERLHPDAGLAAFTHRPEREHAILLRAAQSGHGAVAVAHTPAGAIVGQIVLAGGDDWWRDLAGVYELSIQTSQNWRQLGVARELLQFCVGAPWIDHLILFATGLDWHWDLAGLGLDAREYRSLLRSLFERAGFRVAPTSEPNVAFHPSNLLLVRVGAQVAPVRQKAFDEARLVPPGRRTGAVLTTTVGEYT